VGYLGDKIKEYVTSDYPHINSIFVDQQERNGIAHAIWLARPYIEDDEQTLIILGDTILDADMQRIMAMPASALGVKRVDDPSRFGVAEIDKDDTIVNLIEKPQFPKSQMALVGLYKINETALLFKAIGHLINNNLRNRDEYQLTDALMYMIQQGTVMKSFKINNWYDCGKKDILLETNALLLKKKEPYLSQAYPDSIIIHPVAIGKNCEIKNSVIGPNATIGDGARIHYSIINESIIGAFTEIHHVLLHQSIVGMDAVIKGRYNSVSIGDNTEIDMM
jgi:glucose-1-phosphate thymidylyltransferase